MNGAAATYRLQFHKGFTFRDATALVPYLGPKAAGRVSVLSGIALFQLIARQVFRGPRHPLRHLAAVASVWLLLTVGFEFTIGRAQQKSWSELLDAYKLSEDRLWPLVLTSVVAAPFFWGRRIER